MPGKTTRSSNLELLRILCMLLIIGDHLTGQSGIADYTTLPSSFAFCLIGCGSRIACSVFVLIGGWFLCEQPYKTRRPLSLWLSLWLYTVPVTLLCRLTGLDVSLGALRWAAFPASTRQLWFISDYLLLLLCVPLPVCHTTSGKCSLSSPEITLSHASAIAARFSSEITPRRQFAFAAAFFKYPNARVISRGITSPPIKKFS